MSLTNSTNSIQEYYQWLLDNPKKANKKILAVYKRLTEDIETPREIEHLNKETGEIEKTTYIFDESRGQRVIDFIEKFCHHSKGKWAGQPIKLELFQNTLLNLDESLTVLMQV